MCSGSLTTTSSLRRGGTGVSVLVNTFFGEASGPSTTFRSSTLSAVTPATLVHLLRSTRPGNVCCGPFRTNNVFSNARSVMYDGNRMHGTRAFGVSGSGAFLRAVGIRTRGRVCRGDLLRYRAPLAVHAISVSGTFCGGLSNGTCISIVPGGASRSPSGFPTPGIAFSVPNALSGVPCSVCVIATPMRTCGACTTSRSHLPRHVHNVLGFGGLSKGARAGHLGTTRSASNHISALLVNSGIIFPASTCKLTRPMIGLRVLDRIDHGRAARCSGAVRLSYVVFGPRMSRIRKRWRWHYVLVRAV